MIELLARVRAMLRRRTGYTADTLRLDALALDCSACELSSGGRSTRLNNKEFQIMECFLRNPRQVFSTEDLMAKFWSWDSEAEINVVWTNIANLRRKLSQLGAGVEIKSIRGVGYQLEEPSC